MSRIKSPEPDPPVVVLGWISIGVAIGMWALAIEAVLVRFGLI